ncbi:hypothetical protein COLO4_21345 [Corchorus olitorius]|uniref:Uncharacterized protein n=1 Tax=Corchorus olitorius TaxID=93759 RepID=A0A1R3ITY5_9ROSI|nr:hypothetical protein COLO4_21345 [Corchorus olitorius]
MASFKLSDAEKSPLLAVDEIGFWSRAQLSVGGGG